MNKVVLLFKVIATIGLWLYFSPEILNPNNVPFRFLLNISPDNIGGTFLNFMIFSIGYVVYFSFVVFMSHKVIWSEIPKLKKIQTSNNK
ncbi:transporter [Bacillus thuringiensis]|uniref:transporter n=1 Tax=Bacillus thuringiensis TaxID=1428 RepID=UPI000A3A1E55|nr:transporter [Bacillus thuringiensis]MED3069128.1 transporter [Bacillus thuringiensis]OUB24878.1 transporter [Bacillus thuringiensis serovar palmanyolensis]